MLQPKFVFQNEQKLKEFYLKNSFHCYVPIFHEQYSNDELYKRLELMEQTQQNKHPHYKYQEQLKQKNHIESRQEEVVNNYLLETAIENPFEIPKTPALQPCINQGAIRKVPQIPKPVSSYNKLVEHSAKKVVTNMEEFVCSICERFIEIGHGIVLKECFHQFCRLCIVDSIEHNASTECPFNIEVCKIVISDEEVQSLLSPASYDRVVAKMTDRILNENQADQVQNDLPEIYFLENLADHNYIENIEPFQCPICLTEIDIGEGVVLKNCLHMFCKECLNKTIEHSDDVLIKCPFTDELGSCEFFLQDSEFRSLASEKAIQQQLVKSLKQAELAAAELAFHCKYPDCEGWVIIDQANAGDFVCEVCVKRNCLACKVKK